MITEVEGNLIDLLKSLGLDRETTVATSILLETDENRQKMIDELCTMILDEQITPTEQDVHWIGLALMGKRKESSDTNSTKTEADTE